MPTRLRRGRPRGLRPIYVGLVRPTPLRIFAVPRSGWTDGGPWCCPRLAESTTLSGRPRTRKFGRTTLRSRHAAPAEAELDRRRTPAGAVRLGRHRPGRAAVHRRLRGALAGVPGPHVQERRAGAAVRGHAQVHPQQLQRRRRAAGHEAERGADEAAQADRSAGSSRPASCSHTATSWSRPCGSSTRRPRPRRRPPSSGRPSCGPRGPSVGRRRARRPPWRPWRRTRTTASEGEAPGDPRDDRPPGAGQLAGRPGGGRLCTTPAVPAVVGRRKSRGRRLSDPIGRRSPGRISSVGWASGPRMPPIGSPSSGTILPPGFAGSVSTSRVATAARG